MTKLEYARHLEGCFRIMGDKQDDQTVLWYIETWFEEGLPPGAVIRAVKDIMRDWTGNKWPTPGLISKQARQALRRDTSHLLEGEVSDTEADRDSLYEHNLRWDIRERNTREFLERHPQLPPVLAEEVKREARKWLNKMDLTRLSRSQKSGFEQLHKGFLEGALQGLCIELTRLEDTEGEGEIKKALRKDS